MAAGLGAENSVWPQIGADFVFPLFQPVNVTQNVHHTNSIKQMRANRSDGFISQWLCGDAFFTRIEWHDGRKSALRYSARHQRRLVFFASLARTAGVARAMLSSSSRLESHYSCMGDHWQTKIRLQCTGSSCLLESAAVAAMRADCYAAPMSGTRITAAAANHSPPPRQLWSSFRQVARCNALRAAPPLQLHTSAPARPRGRERTISMCEERGRSKDGGSSSAGVGARATVGTAKRSERKIGAILHHSRLTQRERLRNYE